MPPPTLKTLFFKTLFVMLHSFCLILFLVQTSYAETSDDSPATDFTTPTETAFEEIQKPYLLRPFFEIPTYSFYLGAPDVQGYAFVPNFAPRLGLTAGWKGTQITAAFSLPIPKEETDRRGPSQQQTYILHTQILNQPMDIYYQSYKGFYAGNPVHEFSLNKAERYTQFPKASVNNIGLNVYYVFDRDDYDPRAAFDYTKIPKYNGGSWYMMPFANHLVIDMGEEIIIGSEPDAIQTFPDVHKLSLLSAGSTFGYGHSWILANENTIFSAQGSIGPAAQRQITEDRQGNVEQTYGLSGKAGFRVTLARNTQDETWGGRVFGDVLYSRLGKLDLYSTVLTLQLFYGTRL